MARGGCAYTDFVRGFTRIFNIFLENRENQSRFREAKLRVPFKVMR